MAITLSERGGWSYLTVLLLFYKHRDSSVAQVPRIKEFYFIWDPYALSISGKGDEKLNFNPDFEAN